MPRNQAPPLVLLEPDTPRVRLFESLLENLQPDHPVIGRRPVSEMDLYLALKTLWFEKHCEERRKRHIAETAPPGAWQRWRADPFNRRDDPLAPALLIDGINNGDGTYYFPYLFPKETTIHSALRFHQGLIVSPTRLHIDLQRAWLCYETTSDHRGIRWNRPHNKPVWYLPFLLYGISTDLADEMSNRDLLVYDGDVRDFTVRAELLKSISRSVASDSPTDAIRKGLERGRRSSSPAPCR